MFPPKPPCLDVQAMPALKPKPVLRPTSKKLHTKLINCRDKLFFVAFENKWCLVGVAYKDTMSLNPNCLQDGKFLVDFYILRPKDYWFGAPNQRFWLEYHQPGSSAFLPLEKLLPPQTTYTQESHLCRVKRPRTLPAMDAPPPQECIHTWTV